MEVKRCTQCTGQFEMGTKNIVEIDYQGFGLSQFTMPFQCPDCAKSSLLALAEDWFDEVIVKEEPRTKLFVDWSTYFFAEDDGEREQILELLIALGVLVCENKKKGAWSVMLDDLVMNPDGNNILLNVYFSTKEYAEQYKDSPHWLHPPGKVSLVQYH